MNEDRLRRDLRTVAPPDAERAEERAWSLVSSAYADRPADGSTRSPAGRRAKLAIASAVAVLLAAGLTLTPAGAEVRKWIGDAIDPGRDDAKPALTRLPAPGNLLVTSATGAWIVHDDGSKRLLGNYRQATWSPNGLYVAVTRGRELSAVDPEGTIRWSIARGNLTDPAWSPNEGYRIAYRSGDEVRVIWGDGTNDKALADSAAVEPAWEPRAGRRNVLAYVDGSNRVHITDTDTQRDLARSAPVDRPLELEWSSDGSELLVLARSSLLVLDPGGSVLWQERFSRGTDGITASFAPGGSDVTVIRQIQSDPIRSEVVQLSNRAHGVVEHRLFSGLGRFQGLAYSPDAQRLLVGWKDADQWLFLPSEGSGHVDSVANISKQFDSGTEKGSFPEIDGWCCRPG